MKGAWLAMMSQIGSLAALDPQRRLPRPFCFGEWRRKLGVVTMVDLYYHFSLNDSWRILSTETSKK